MAKKARRPKAARSVRKQIVPPITNVPLELEDAFDPLGPYGDALGGFSLTNGPAPRPTLNGSLLINSAGTVWLVVNGVARGYVSCDLLARVHEPYTSFPSFQPTVEPWLQRRIMGQRPQVHPADIKHYFTHIQSIDFITESAPWSESVRIVWAVDRPLAIYNWENGQGVLYKLPSALVRDEHKLRGATSNGRLTVEEYDSYDGFAIDGTKQ